MKDVSQWGPLIMALLAVIGAVAGALRSAWRFAKAQAVAEVLRDQSAATILAKNAELADLEADNRELKAENGRLWTLLQERSQ